MSANTLTGLIPTLYRAANQVAREQTGFITGAYMDSTLDQVAKDQTIRYPIMPALTAADISPAATGPDAAGKTVSYGDMTISKSRSVQIPFNGDEGVGLGRTKTIIMQEFFAQAIRTLVNEIETDLFLAAKRGASRAYGTAGTTPFGTAGNFTDFAEIRKILIDNGAPASDLHLVLNTTSGAKLRGLQSSLFKVDEAGGDDSFLRQGNLGMVEGMMLHESGQIVLHTKGTGASYVFNGSHAAGATSVVAKTGTGTVLYGDVVTFEDDTANKYVVNTGIAAAGTMVIGGPGLRQAQTDGKTITVGANYTGNWAFNRAGLHLLTRLPLMPTEGDAAADVTVITDPYSGLSFQVALYKQYRQVSYEIGIAWGVAAVKSNFIATLLG
jgi:hypothetical protein